MLQPSTDIRTDSLSSFHDMTMDEKLNYVFNRLRRIEDQLPDSNIIHPKFWTRAWTVFGHNLAIGLVIYAVIFAIVMLASLS